MAGATAAAGTTGPPGAATPAGQSPAGPTADVMTTEAPVATGPQSATPSAASPVHPIDDESMHLDGPDPGTPARGRSRTGQRLLVVGVVAALIAGWFAVLTWITRDDETPLVTSPTTTLAQPAAGTPVPVVTTTVTQPPATTTAAPEPTTTVDPDRPHRAVPGVR